MLLCPVDLHVCDRIGCRGGRCALADAPPLVLCWECGSVEGGRSRIGVCAACLRAYAPDATTEEN